MENLSLDQVIDQMTEIIEEAKTLLFSKNVVLNREMLLGYIDDLRLKLPDEIKHARYITEQRQKILGEAQKEADLLVKNAENLIARRIDDHEITKEAYKAAEKIMSDAKQTAKDIRLGSLQYADEILEEVEKQFYEKLQEIKENRRDLKR